MNGPPVPIAGLLWDMEMKLPSVGQEPADRLRAALRHVDERTESSLNVADGMRLESSRIDLRRAKVIGFFSLPSLSLAEENPQAYNNAIAAAPLGSGACEHCGTGIRHHVIICDETGRQAFIGTTCAEQVGSEDVRRCVREHKTSEQIALEDVERSACNAKTSALEVARKEKRARVAVKVSGLADQLADGRNGFCDSVARGLREGDLPTGRGLSIVIDILAKKHGRRGSKAYNAAWDTVAAQFDDAAAILAEETPSNFSA